MNHGNKGKAKIFLAWCCAVVLLLLTYHFNVFAQRSFSFTTHAAALSDTPPPLNKIADTALSAPAKKDSFHLPSVKTVTRTADSFNIPVIDTFHFRMSKDSLSAPVIYHADDSMVINVPAQMMYLYGKVASVKYQDNFLSAPLIQFDQRQSVMSAFLQKDSAGKVLNYPFFSEKDAMSVFDTIRFNLKTGRGLTKGTYTKQGDMFVYGDKIKKADTSTFYAYGARFTTCDLDTPHFAFIAKKAIFVNKKWAYTGPVHPEFEGVPLPITLPFGIFPLTQGRHSGLLPPTFTANDQLGLSLENLGYYKIISPDWDVITRGTIYSYGSYTVTANPRYYSRYHYRGNIGFTLQKIHPLDEASTRTMSLQWSHNSDTKARPGVNFTANVNAASSKFNEEAPNSPQLNFQNQLSSSITYSKVWKNKPFNISISANHNQNTVQRLINLNFPDVAFNVNTLYPFRRAEPIGNYKWYENLGIAYNGTAKSLSSFYDTAGHVFNQISHNLQYGAQHNIPLTLSLPPLGVIQLAPSVTYQETWYQRRIVKSYDAAAVKFDTLSIRNGFYTARQMSFGLSASTRIFGMFTFGKNSRIKAIRHEIRPSISLSYSPNFNANNYYRANVDAYGNTQSFSYYDGSVYGAYSNQRFGGLSFSLDNNVTMKTRGKSDTAATADKKISLLDGLNLTGGYNFLQDSFRLLPFNLSARTNLLNKFNVSGNAIFDPYQVNSDGRRIDKLIWAQRPLSFGHLTTANVSLQSSFKGGKDHGLAPGQPPPSTLQNPNLPQGVTLDEYQQEAAYVQSNPSEFVDFSIPWSVDFSYSLIVSRGFDVTRQGFKSTITQGSTFNASANLTEKWKVGLNGTYDISDHQLGVLSGYLSRDMHCWQMGINVSPVGRYRFFSINISPKSPILRDLKVNRTRSFTDF